MHLFISGTKTSNCHGIEGGTWKTYLFGTIIEHFTIETKPFVEKELQNCISDCIKIYEKSKSDYCWRFKHSF